MKTLKFKPYFFEPLRSRKKMATIRKSDKGLKKGDLCFRLYLKDQHHHYNISKLNRRILKMNKEEINELTAKIEACWDENNPGDVESFDERLKQKLTPEEYELITSWR